MRNRLHCLLATLTFGLAACAGPVEFSATAAAPPPYDNDGSADFSSMDDATASCKASAIKAGAGKCTQVRAYEACMKTRGYITVLGPENPRNCGEPGWEKDVRKWLE
ncbi:MAG TPA: hypothetical protein VJS30_06455 [Paraburkholderia sp.]|nr:hypothetical protein [Paraburkholderia sp.]